MRLTLTAATLLAALLALATAQQPTPRQQVDVQKAIGPGGWGNPSQFPAPPAGPPIAGDDYTPGGIVIDRIEVWDNVNGWQSATFDPQRGVWLMPAGSDRGTQLRIGGGAVLGTGGGVIAGSDGVDFFWLTNAGAIPGTSAVTWDGGNFEHVITATNAGDLKPKPVDGQSGNYYSITIGQQWKVNGADKTFTTVKLTAMLVY